jgi:hypothetical protein
MSTQRGSVEAIKKMIDYGSRISVDEMASIAEMANALGGGLVAVEPDDDWCGTGKIIFKWPPKDEKLFIQLLDRFAQARINYEVLINGIPDPYEVVFTIHRGELRQAGAAIR